MRRRQFVQLALAGGVLGLLATSGLNYRASRAQPLVLSGSDRGGKHTLCGWQPGIGECFRLDVPLRVHAPLMRPFSREVVFVARRPGRAIYVVDIDEAVIHTQVEATQGRHFYGHAVFSADGRWLFVPENAFDEQGRGTIGVYDAKAQYQRVDEFDLQGVGPHQLVLMPDGFTLAVALGGIQTHPNRRRDKLNLASMRSALLYLNSHNGQITQRFEAMHQHLSLRHLDVATDGTLVVGAQFQVEADPDEDYRGPLVFSQRLDQPLKPLQATPQVWRDQRHYIASVAMNSQGSQVVTTSPRGGVVNLWQIATGRLIKQHRVNDVSGAGYLQSEGCFVVSNGAGQLFRLNKKPQLLASLPDTRWDNHLVAHG